jgi:hypothetical protein
MDLIYPINCVGYNEWSSSGYSVDLSSGDVITRHGEILGTWRVVDYDPEDEYSSGRFEFVADGEDIVKLSETFAMLDVRVHRGLELSNFSRKIREWHES